MALVINSDGVSINFAKRSFDDFRRDFFALAEANLPEWSDLNDYDPGVILGGYSARLGTYLNFYLNRYTNEQYPTTARLMSSFKKMSALSGYHPSPQTTASVDVIMTTIGPGWIPKYFTVGSSPDVDSAQVQYEVLEAFYATGPGQYAVTCYHGITREDKLIGTSRGTPFQQFRIIETPVATQSSGLPAVSVEVFEGDEWRRWSCVPDWLASGPMDRHYRSFYNDFSELVIETGDGVTGRIPPIAQSQKQNIRATYRIGGGPAGMSPGRGRVNQITNPRGCTIVSSVVNLKKPSGGRPAETVDQVKANAPRMAAVRTSIVSFDDAAAMVLASGLGVQHIKLSHGTGPLDVRVVVGAYGSNPVPTGYWDSYLGTGAGLLGAVGQFIQTRCSNNWILTILPAVPVPVITEFLVKCASWSYQSDVGQRVKTATDSFLVATNQNLGQGMEVSAFSQCIREIDGVEGLVIREFRRSPRAKFVSGVDGAAFGSYSVGEHIEDEVWRVIFISEKVFRVVGSVSGEQQNTGVLAHPKGYQTDNGQLAFRVVPLTSKSPSPGTIYSIRTSKYIGSIMADADEIITIGTSIIHTTGGVSQ